MQIMIECEYCGSIYDFSESHTCPNCAAIPDKKKVAIAKAEAKKSAQPTVKNQKPPSSQFMTIIVKLVPLWIFLIIAFPIIAVGIENKAAENAVQHLNVVDELTYEEHVIGEDFWYEDMVMLNIDDAFYSDSEVVNTLLPDDKKLLVVHVKGSVEEIDDDYFSYTRFSSVNPYVTNGEYCRSHLTYSSLDTVSEVYATNIFSFTNFSEYNMTRDGYWCFIVDSDDTEVSLCINDISVENKTLDIDLVHRILIPITE